MKLSIYIMVMLITLIGTGLTLTGCGASADNAAIAKAVPAVETAQPDLTKENTAHNAQTREGYPVIVFLGDSLSAGFGLPPEDALPEQVQDEFDAMGLHTKVINAGVSGDTSANGLARYDWSAGSLNPDLLILALGANDYLLDIAPEITRGNLSAILEQAHTANISVVLVGLQPRSKSGTENRDITFAAIYPELSVRFDVPLFPAMLEGVRDTPSLLQSDGLHPTKAGVSVMAKRLALYLTPYVKAVEPK